MANQYGAKKQHSDASETRSVTNAYVVIFQLLGRHRLTKIERQGREDVGLGGRKRLGLGELAGSELNSTGRHSLGESLRVLVKAARVFKKIARRSACGCTQTWLLMETAVRTAYHVGLGVEELDRR